jgi:hypothetical protein
VVADDRSGQAPGVFSRPVVPPTGATTQSASFDIGSVRLELVTSSGVIRLVVTTEGNRETHAIDVDSLIAWSAATTKLLGLLPVATAAERSEFRAPWLLDHDGKAVIAFEGLVTEQSVTYRLLVARGPSAVTGIMTSGDVLRSLAEAAVGAAAVARASA